MGKLSKDEVCVLILTALVLMCSASPRHYFLESRKLSWDDAREYCQLCFKDLVTVTPDNVQKIAENLTSDHWIGLRKNFYNTSNSTSNSTGYTTSSPIAYSTSYWTSSSPSYSTSNSTGNTSLIWSRWADGDRLIFQNWYPGWPVFKSPFPRRDCCSCSCTCPAKTTPTFTTPSPDYSTPDFTSNDTSNSTAFWESRMQNGTNGTTELYDVSGNMTNSSRLWENGTTATPYTTAAPPTTPTLPLEAECERSPMPFPDVPDPDENYIEDSCVAMLSFGPWVEKNCFELLPFVCYDDDFVFETNATSVTNLTSVSAALTWQSVPGITHYKLEVKGHADRTRNLTNVTHGLDNLTPGTHYSVLVFPVRCGRDLKAQEFSFTTIPSKVENFRVFPLNETSILYLSWDQPVGHVDAYRIQYFGDPSGEFETKNTHAQVDELTPGSPYTFTIISLATGPNTTRSEETTLTLYTKPEKVTNLVAYNNSREWLMLSWDRPEGITTGYWVNATDEKNNLNYNETVTETTANVTNLMVSHKITLSVTALANYTLEGETVTIFSYTAPEPISNLVLNRTHNTIIAKWKNSSLGRDSRFNIKLKLGNLTVERLNITDRTYTFHNLKTAAKYTVIIYVNNGHVNGPSVENSIFTLPSPPTNPKALRDKENITFSWTAPANSSTVTYVVDIKSNFWGYSSSSEVFNDTQYTFTGLKSGTKYDLQVKTKANGTCSTSVGGSWSTDPDLRQITLSMMCSSKETLLCDKNATRKNVFNQLNERFKKLLGDSVNWTFLQDTVN